MKTSTAETSEINLINPVWKESNVSRKGKIYIHDMCICNETCGTALTLYASVMFNIFMSIAGLSFLVTRELHIKNPQAIIMKEIVEINVCV